MWLSPKWFCFLFIYFVLYHGPEASKVQIKLTYLLDIIAAEAHYHASCYNNYARVKGKGQEDLDQDVHEDDTDGNCLQLQLFPDDF